MNLMIDVTLRVAEKIKPVLIRLLPMELLRSTKKRMINSALVKLEHANPLIPFDRSANPDGVNLIGFAKAETGLGQSCRLVAAGLDESAIDFTVYNYEHANAVRFDDLTWNEKITNTTPFNINIIHINPNELPHAFIRLGRQVWDRRYNIAFWLWELEQFPEEWLNVLELANEIWTPAEFVSQNLRKITNKPVKTIPYAFAMPECGNYGRQDFNLPDDKFLFLCMYDSISILGRKNPLGIIEAFKQSFPQENSSVGLVIKINNAVQNDIQAINEALSGYQNVYLITCTLSRVQVYSLIKTVDAYVSLHRAEGFGLTMAEAMLLGTPVIATNWSANTEFMDRATACLVDYEFVEIKSDQGPFKAGNRWAEPSISHAAEYMKKLYDDSEYRNALSMKAKARIESQLAPKKIAELIKSRISEIYETKEIS